MENEILSQESVENALNQLRAWFPEQAMSIAKHKDELVTNILQDTEPDPDTSLGQVADKAVAELAIAVPATSASANSKTAAFVQRMALPNQVVPQIADEELFFTLTPCNIAIGKAMFSSGLFILGMAGIRAKANDRMYHAFLAEFGPVADKFMRLFNEFDAAVGYYAKGKKFFEIAGGLYKASCLKALIKSWAEEADWFDWVSTAALAIAQFTVWFATEGIAFIAEVVLLLASAGFLIADIAHAVSVCTKGDCKPAATTTVVSKFKSTGSYSYTAEDVQVMLSAQCKNMAGNYVESTIDITNFTVNTQIDNNNGKLMVAKTTGVDASTFQPFGSYRSSSQKAVVTLTASCKDANGNKVRSSLNITDLPLDADIANINGQLKVV